ncbi:hypothetical protein [Barrientosiimonas humi]|uniref:hypothetical protein n=1 Tax=Barrientosiimonas humi TaxID=999931 RepID=UPI00370D8D7F
MVGREVVGAALEAADPVSAAAVRGETAWRTAYPGHFRRLVEIAAHAPQRTVPSARAGLDRLHSAMRWEPAPGGDDEPLAAALDAQGATLATEVVEGGAEPERELSIPLRGKRIRGAELTRQLDDWVDAGVMEPGAREAVRRVQDNPDWLRLEGRTLVVLGAGAEMGPLRAVLRLGATVAAVDLPRPQLWRGVLADATERAGRLLLPVGADSTGELEQRAGADLLHDPAAVARWLGTVDGPLVLGNYVYADGGTNLRLAAAVDALTERVAAERDDSALAFLATPTDVFEVPGDAVAQSRQAYADAGFTRFVRAPLRAASGGRLLRRQYAPGLDGPLVSDAIVPQQGPNYLLAKRIHRWRATSAAADGRLVSMTVAPPTRTRSVTKNRALAAAYAGAHRFGVQVFEPATASTLMAAMLVHDLHTGGVAARPGTPLQAESHTAVHGGTWRIAYDPRSALGIAALLGWGAARP